MTSRSRICCATVTPQGNLRPINTGSAGCSPKLPQKETEEHALQSASKGRGSCTISEGWAIPFLQECFSYPWLPARISSDAQEGMSRVLQSSSKLELAVARHRKPFHRKFSGIRSAILTPSTFASMASSISPTHRTCPSILATISLEISQPMRWHCAASSD